MKQLLFAIPIFTLVMLCACSSNATKSLIKEIEEQNRLMPMMVNANSRADSIVFKQDTHTIIYYYTFFNEADRLFSKLEIENFTQQLSSEIKQTQGMENHRKQKLEIHYVYHSQRTNEEIAKIIITPSMYQ